MGWVVVEENIWEISISCPALRLPILLSPEQGRRTEEPLNCSQHADWGGFAAVGSGHMLGAGRLGQLLCGRFLLSRPLIPSSELCCDGESMSFAGDRGKPLTGQHFLLAHPIFHPEPSNLGPWVGPRAGPQPDRESGGGRLSWETPWAVLAYSLSWPEIPTYLKSIPQRGQE